MPSSDQHKIVLVRHADAGDRTTYKGPDYRRPLSQKGSWQAAQIALELTPLNPTQILTSRSVRCFSTVTPLAKATCLEIHECDELFEGSDPREAWNVLITSMNNGAGTLVACSHGDVIPGIIGLLADAGLRFDSPPKIKKASMTILKLKDGHVLSMQVRQSPRFVNGSGQ